VQKKPSILVATPMLTGCTAGYCSSVVQLALHCQQHGITCAHKIAEGCSLVAQARNALCADFLETDYDQLLFIDADITFQPADVLAISTLATKVDKSVVVAAVPRKQIPTVFNFEPLNDQPQHADKPQQIAAGGTAFMIIQRQTLERFANAYPELESVDGVRNRRMHAFFNTEVDLETKVFTGEDYSFCRRIRRIGMQVWLCPWVTVSHVGLHEFRAALCGAT
jgi:hypothetical protein